MSLKDVLASLSTELVSKAQGPREDRVVVLCYHSIHPHNHHFSTTPAVFEQHLCWLKEHCEVIAFRDALAQRKSHQFSHPQVAITFDDGFKGYFDYAFPILEKHDLKATFFLTTGLLERETQTLTRFEASAPGDDLTPLSWEQVLKLRVAGHDIGAHTHRHPHLGKLISKEVEFELRHSKRLIEERLGKMITLFAYPYGLPRQAYTGNTVAMVKEAGYRQAACMLARACLPTDPAFEIPRFDVAGDRLDQLAHKIYGARDHLAWVREHLPFL